MHITEGDFVMGQTTEGVMHGVVEHIMNEGGTLGTPGSEYALESMPPENPAMSVRLYKKENGIWKPTAYSIGMMYKDATIVDIKDKEKIWQGSAFSLENETEPAFGKSLWDGSAFRFTKH